MSISPEKRVILVIGSNRGIGLGLVQRYLEQEDHSQIVVGSYRSVEIPSSLSALESQYPGSFYSIGGLDVSDINTIQPFITSFTERFKRLDTLIVNAGIFGDKDLNYDSFVKVMTINALAPSHILTGFKPLLEETHTKLGGVAVTSYGEIKPDSETNIDNVTRVRVAFISSILGSTTLNYDSAPIYKASKAALNNMIRSIAKTIPCAGIQLIHPGWVATDMGGESAPLDIKTSTSGIVSTIHKTCYISRSVDSLYQWDGEKLPW